MYIADAVKRQFKYTVIIWEVALHMQLNIQVPKVHAMHTCTCMLVNKIWPK